MLPIQYDMDVPQDTALPIVLTDRCNERGGMSLTNGIDDVIEQLYRSGVLSPDRRLLYYDSDGELTEALHKNGVFAGYKMGVLP